MPSKLPMQLIRFVFCFNQTKSFRRIGNFEIPVPAKLYPAIISALLICNINSEILQIKLKQSFAKSLVARNTHYACWKTKKKKSIEIINFNALICSGICKLFKWHLVNTTYAARDKRLKTSISDNTNLPTALKGE